MESEHIEIVKFNGVDLVCPIINGNPFVAMKCIIDDLKMHSKTATRNLKNHPRFGPRVAEWQPAKPVLNFSSKHTYLCLPLQKVAGWLYSIGINHVGEEVKPILFIYQEKCDDVLFEKFFGGNNNVVKFKEKALPLSIEVKDKEAEVKDAELVLKKMEEYISVQTLKDELARLKKKKRSLERNFLEPTLF